MIGPRVFVRIKVSFIAIIAVFATGCATIGGTRQAVVVTSKPHGADVYYKGGIVGQTPAPVIIDRSSKEEIVVKYKDIEKKVVVDGKFRSEKVLLGNFAYLSFFWVGILADTLSGAAYGMVTPAEVLFPGHENAPPPPAKPKIIAIAPPTSAHANLSDEIGPILERRMREDTRYPGRVMSYQDTLKTFLDEDVDADSPFEYEHASYIYSKLGATHLLLTEADVGKNKTKISGQLISYESPTQKEKFAHEVDTASLKFANDNLWAGADRRVFYFLPNSVSLDYIDSISELNVDGRTIEGEPDYPNDFVGKASQVLSSVSIRRISPPINRQGWNGRTIFIPTANFSYSQDTYPDFLEVNSRTFFRSHIDAGYGPSLLLENQRHIFYWNIIPVLSWTQIRAYGIGSDIREEDGRVELVSELGYSYFINRHWSARFFIRRVGVNDALWEKVFQKATGNFYDVEDAALVNSGASISYTFPNKILSPER